MQLITAYFQILLLLEVGPDSERVYEFPALDKAFSAPHWPQGSVCCSVKQYCQYNRLDLSLKIRQVLFNGNSGQKGMYHTKSNTNINM